MAIFNDFDHCLFGTFKDKAKNYYSAFTNLAIDDFEWPFSSTTMKFIRTVSVYYWACSVCSRWLFAHCKLYIVYCSVGVCMCVPWCVLVGTYIVKYLHSELVTVIAFWSSHPAVEIVCCVLKSVPHSICMSQHLRVVMLRCFLGKCCTLFDKGQALIAVQVTWIVTCNQQCFMISEMVAYWH